MEAIQWMIFGIGAWEIVKWAVASLELASRLSPEEVEQNLNH